MGTWWLGLSLMQQIFYTIAIASSVVLIIQIILNPEVWLFDAREGLSGGGRRSESVSKSPLGGARV